MFVAVQAYGQSVKVETKAPAVVAADEMFRVEFTSSQRPENFRAPDFAGFNVLAGPSISESQSISIVQNNMTQTVQYTYTYVLKPTATGNFTIGQAVISIGGKEYSTRSTPIEVVAEGSPRPAGQGRQQGGAQQQAASAVAEDDIILRASVSRTSVFKGEPVRVTFKIYTRVPLGRSENEKFPSFNGFWSQELDTSNSKWQRESYNNKVYESRVLGEYLLYPLQSGALQIDPFQLTVTAHSINHRPRRSIFDDMMGGGPDILEEKKLIRSQPITITVNELPGGAPEGFEGAVGNFTMEADPPSGTINANSAVTYTRSKYRVRATFRRYRHRR